MPAEPASVPRIAGRANRETCRRSLSATASWLNSSATNPRSIPTAIAHPSQDWQPVTISIPWARWLRLKAVRVTATEPTPIAVPAWRRRALAARRSLRDGAFGTGAAGLSAGARFMVVTFSAIGTSLSGFGGQGRWRVGACHRPAFYVDENYGQVNNCRRKKTRTR